ncbi:50S ribosomal protein L17 [Candidatus Parcubacteria bacterium]|nr:50S ribosomal protein L17 [Patescibacteria group bacterium]MBU4309444.1 50S ribosomal protein L17 [Patescibacteria group bacterium]MBU4432241.1 50S ribosomal protein L17 [Patescibacteria group bacterium]MBU4577805.1 50S ribosomal protein L17 [Patescibacteria group bacterium]MCG2696798.1 50S ribosomal protein L17 [Candidatus Parcubacteria bacterium]
MRHRVKTKTLDREKSPRELMLRNMASSVVMYEKIQTTTVKAKVVRSLVEKYISVAKKGDLASRRKLIAELPQKMAVMKLMDVLGAKYKEVQGGYTRIVKIGNRKGDGAEISQIELV